MTARRLVAVLAAVTVVVATAAIAIALATGGRSERDGAFMGIAPRDAP